MLFRSDFESYEPIDFNKNKHPLFKEILNVNNQRMKHLQIMARFTMIEIADGYTELKDISVEDFINDNQYDNGIGNLSFKNKKEANETIFNLNLFYDIFKNDPIKDNKNGIKEFNVEYFIISFYLLIRHLRKHYIVDNSLKSHINSFMHEFYYRWRHASDNDLDIAIFSNNRQQSRNNLEIRDRILRQLFFAYLRENNFDLKEKDSKRVFSEDQKIAIYRRDNGLCQKCLVEGKSEKESLVSWSEFDADHILPHSRGGQTILENGQVLCRYHNQQKSNK